MSFKLCYIWIDKFRNFENFGVNFSSSEKFDFDSDNLSLNKTEVNNVPDDFFGKDISEVTGFIGKNGTGKSNLLELVCKLVKGGETSVKSDFFIIIENEGEYECHYRFRDPQEIRSHFPILLKEYKSDIDNLKVIYFSNVFDERTHAFDKKVSDLSANNRYPKHNWPSKTKTSDFVKQLQFIKGDLFIDSEIPLPKQLTITPRTNIYSASYWTQSFISNNTLNEFFSNELKSFYTGVKSLKASRQKLYYFFIFSVITDLISLLKDFSGQNETFDSKVEYHIDNLLAKTEEIKNTYKSKLNIAETWKEWSFKILSEFYKDYFKYNIKNKRKYPELETLQDNLLMLVKFEEFIENKEMLSTLEGSRNRKTDNYILEFHISTSKLDEQFYNFIDKSNRFKIDWLGLSSGHKAYLNLFSLLRFELKNIKADNVLICIDEGDLYLHPKWQADFFYKLVNLVPKFKSANYQFILTSHSPFLVSDLPKENLVFLGGDSENYSSIIRTDDSIKTFGGNLGELYVDAFFMEGGLISRFAANKIQEIVNKINDNVDISIDDRKLIDLIGEDLIRIQINNLLNDPNRRK
ncbi:AAA family ATPase [Lacinutrix neustonica]|uniref:AAA family ATPase n=1 Tax=Lacinutrix neustonica TaxID=2980107 RepID=A0A9E8MVR9_9FLAO|nr:AAA family ATPase [Lacinutrix neustonica]WAC02261.1 AAA family ATPase [Lacinutrix neustonica]